MRLRAAQEAGLKEIWIDVAEGWSIEKQNEFIIKDNSSFGEWDWDRLANTWESDYLNNWALDLPTLFEGDLDLDLDRTKKDNVKCECCGK